MSVEKPPSIPPEHTQPSLASTSESAEDRPRLWPRLRWFLLLFILAVVAAGVLGYFSGVQAREEARTNQAREQAAEQFELGVEDLEAGRYERARQRFEYVIEIDPSYPGVPEKMAEVLLALNQPTARPTVAASPTPNLAPVEEIFTQAQMALQAEEWTQAIETLLALRDKDAGFRAIQVDGMMYTALRNRGVDRIANQGLLAEGIYDLARAETIGPLDRDAGNWKDWAELYLQANSYMGVNWGRAVSAWAQVYLVAPYLRNDAYIKYAVSAQNYADLLHDADDPCAAEEMYDESLLAWDNATLYPTATEAYEDCRTATAPAPKPTSVPKDTPTPPAEEPTAAPTEPQEGGEDGNGSDEVDGGNGGEETNGENGGGEGDGGEGS